MYKLHLNIKQHIASHDLFICINILDQNLRIFKSLLGIRLIFIFENMTKAWRYWLLLKQMYMYKFGIYSKFHNTNISIMSNDILLEIIQPREKKKLTLMPICFIVFRCNHFHHYFFVIVIIFRNMCMESCMFVEVNDSATLFFNFEELKTYLIITFANYISFIYMYFDFEA